MSTMENLLKVFLFSPNGTHNFLYKRICRNYMARCRIHMTRSKKKKNAKYNLKQRIMI